MEFHIASPPCPFPPPPPRPTCAARSSRRSRATSRPPRRPSPRPRVDLPPVSNDFYIFLHDFTCFYYTYHLSIFIIFIFFIISSCVFTIYRDFMINLMLYPCFLPDLWSIWGPKQAKESGLGEDAGRGGEDCRAIFGGQPESLGDRGAIVGAPG